MALKPLCMAGKKGHHTPVNLLDSRYCCRDFGDFTEVVSLASTYKGKGASVASDRSQSLHNNKGAQRPIKIFS